MLIYKKVSATKSSGTFWVSNRQVKVRPSNDPRRFSLDLRVVPT